jgi:hypothetical protein
MNHALIAVLLPALLGTAASAQDVAPFPPQAAVALDKCPAGLAWDATAHACGSVVDLDRACSVSLAYDPQDPSKMVLLVKPGPGCSSASLEYALDAARARLRWAHETLD